MAARTELPAPLVEADAALHALLSRTSFSPHLNPVNIDEARRVFFAGAPVPPFAYAPADWADALLSALDRVRPPEDHPLGLELLRCREELRALTLALRDRDAASFDRLNRLADYYPGPEDAVVGEGADGGGGPPTLGADRMEDTLRAALAARGLDHWRILRDPVMAARVLVDGAKALIRLNPAARFRELDLRTLVAHEIDVHATRARNGEAQPLRIFQDGLAHSLLTEEGLALLAESRVAGLGADFFARQQLFLDAIALARGLGFREVFATLAEQVPSGLAWGLTLRVKRGLARPGEPGVYAKDSVYARGWRRVSAWLEAGGDLARLYVGKVAVEHPVEAWIAEGWVRPMPVPDLWAEQA